MIPDASAVDLDRVILVFRDADERADLDTHDRDHGEKGVAGGVRKDASAGGEPQGERRPHIVLPEHIRRFREDEARQHVKVYKDDYHDLLDQSENS